jgi:thiol-disulfide isomerase/thioredoxin
VRLQLAQIDQEFIADHPKYGWAVKNETLSDFYGNLCVSYWGDVMPDSLFKVISKHQPCFTSNDGVSFYKYLQSYTVTQNNNKKAKGLEGTLAWYDLTFTPQKSDLLKLFLLDDAKNSFARSFPAIISSIQTKWCKKIAKDELTKSEITQKKIDSLFAISKKIETADIGRPLVKLPFEAELYQIDSLKNVDDFILSLKSKFVKKALIIDFWATWCAPCLSDLPFSKSLHEANKDLPIEYIYLCSSSASNINIWKNKVAELQIPGTHIFVDDKIITKLKVVLSAASGFPAYVVIDANGKVNTKAISRMELLNRDSVKQAAGL